MPDAEGSGSAFGFAPVVALEATGSVLSADGRSSAHHTTNIVVSAGPGDESRGRSQALGVLDGEPSRRAVFQADGLRRTADSRRISQRVMQVMINGSSRCEHYRRRPYERLCAGGTGLLSHGSAVSG
ncbi:hypothetical protein [Streptomyces doebereineriae]|uniref:Uncharacterized protein n=1 Tax=Streptomyces doebereineriae TaxID=3075528 RepID=A0ABU2V129_9ACTN|nr:hypothetical protein [Streptomyces sp. DSM 41640]MDT0479258.1 hypothetical protein [Streptomyces sp. DSM 41640]